MLTTNEIRTKFLNFFKSKGHTVVASDSLVPKDDPTVLFTTAGMQQFKPQFLGRDLTYTKATTCQKCLRTDDLDVVGTTNFHHTFFEMLGNFSFGDYFKKDAINWAWEFFTVELKLPKEKLWASVYQDDQEAYDIWINDIKLPKERLVRLGDKSNFWPSNARLNGPNGPCGPCSEIFFDYGHNPNCPNGDKCDPDCSCGRFAEVWNLVFTQFNRKDGGVLDPLPAKNIDTGMGLERLAAVVQGKRSNYENDVFAPILNEIKGRIKGIFEKEARIIADHMRAIVFGINDGVVPSNEGRGYVIRKLIIILADIASQLGIEKPIIYTFVDVTIKAMNAQYPEITNRANEIKSIIERLEEQYIKLKKDRIPELKSKLNVQLSVDQLADIGFFFRDTYGLSMAIITKELEEAKIDNGKIKEIVIGIEKRLNEQRERSRASSKMTGDVFTDAAIDLNVPKTKFLGYEILESKGQVLKAVREGNNVKFILDQTPFYAQSGGQTGDTGIVKVGNAIIKVSDTQKINDIYIHSGTIENGDIKEGDNVTATVDALRRQYIMRNHSATHLLQSALRDVLGGHIKQQGSLVAPDRLRFDFSHPTGVKKEDLQRIEDTINGFIKQGDAVNIEVLPLEEAKKKGALAFFAEKYGDTVRVVTMGSYSKEFCGGTHVKNTKDIEVLKIVTEGSVAQGIRRIEAVTGKESVEKINALKAQEDAVLKEQQQKKEAEKKELQQRFEAIKTSVDNYLKSAESINGVPLIKFVEPNIDMMNLRKLSDIFKQKIKSGIFVLASKAQGSGAVIVVVTDDVVAKGVKANEIISQIAPIFEGTGGGKAEIAQAGSKNPAKIDEAVSRIKEFIKL